MVNTTIRVDMLFDFRTPRFNARFQVQLANRFPLSCRSRSHNFAQGAKAHPCAPCETISQTLHPLLSAPLATHNWHIVDVCARQSPHLLHISWSSQPILFRSLALSCHFLHTLLSKHQQPQNIPLLVGTALAFSPCVSHRTFCSDSV